MTARLGAIPSLVLSVMLTGALLLMISGILGIVPRKDTIASMGADHALSASSSKLQGVLSEEYTQFDERTRQRRDYTGHGTPHHGVTSEVE